MTTITAQVTGPFMIRAEDLGQLNALFSDAFSERYRRDGMSGVRVPPLNPSIWRYAIEGAREGAMLWRDGLGRIAAFNLAHASGTEGWMGPLAVRDELQGQGLGRTIVRAGIEHLKGLGCRTIGLETMPRTMDNIGFYAGLGFAPGPLTVTATVEAGSATDLLPPLLSQLGKGDRAAAIAECAALSSAVRAGCDYSREIELTLRHGLGDCLLVRDGHEAVTGFALFHDAPLVEGRSREEMRVLKLVLADAGDLVVATELLAAHARRAGCARAAIRVQGEYRQALRMLVARGARVRWTDLRMTLAGFDEVPTTRGLAISNWEI